MTRTRSLICRGAMLATAFAATAAFAQTPPEGPAGPPATRAELQARIAEHFKLADINKDGFVTRAEFDAARAAMKAKFAAKREEHRAEKFAMLDKNRDGSLSKDEFLAPPPHGPDGNDAPDGHGDHDMPPPPPGAGPDAGPGGGPDGPRHGRRMMMMRHHGGMEMGGRWFEQADADHDGRISLAEASARPLAMFDRVDTDHDGRISPEERKAAIEMMRDRMKDKRG